MLARPTCGLSVARYADFSRDSESADFFPHKISKIFNMGSSNFFQTLRASITTLSRLALLKTPASG